MDALSHMPQYNSQWEDVIQAMILLEQLSGQVQGADLVNPWLITLQEALLQHRWLVDNTELVILGRGLVGKETSYTYLQVLGIPC